MRKPSTAKKRNNKIHLRPISEVAESAGIKKKFLELHGPFKAKLSLELLSALKKKTPGKYIVMTSLTPSPLGEGKTVTSIGLSMALKKLKKKAIACLIQPSLGGVFGLKGPGSGGGKTQIYPTEDINFHLAGDTHAVEFAHNLCAAHLDNVLFRGNPFDIDMDSITWKRVTEVNDRFLRNVNIGMGSKADGITRRTAFEITTSSELMAILALASDLKDLKTRIGKVILGFTKKGKPITCEHLKITGALTAILKEALKPNLVQTSEGTACLVHTSSIADTSIGTSSVVADKIAMGLSDYTISETGFGAELGAEKTFDIKCRIAGIKPDAAVIVCTIRALKMHSGDYEITTSKIPREISSENVSAVERGFSNLEKQIENITNYGIPVVLCINRFPGNTEKEIDAIKKRAAVLGINNVAVSDVWNLGGQGGLDLAKAVIEACKIKHSFRYLYPLDLPIKDRIKRIAKTLYGAKEVTFSDTANKSASLLKKLKIDNLPICMAKTHLSLSHNPKRRGRPHGFKLPVEEIRIYNGAGFVTAFCANVKTMPGLSKTPRSTKIDLAENGAITGIF